jgi:hypothetical protein
LKAVIVAHAQRDENPDASLKNMVQRAEELLDLWPRLPVS